MEDMRSSAPRQFVDIELSLASDLMQLSQLQEAADCIDAAEKAILDTGLQHSAQQVRLLQMQAGLADGNVSLTYLQKAWTLAGTVSDTPADLRDMVESDLAQA